MPAVGENNPDSAEGTDYVEGPSDRDCLQDDFHRKQALKSEDARLETFGDWPKSMPVSKEGLAKDGFYYLQTGDKVKCIFCNLILKSWDPGDNARIEHQKFNALCPFLIQRNVGNIPILRPVSQATATSSKQVKHPQYATAEARLASFTSWQMDLNQTPQDLVEAGFYFTGVDDSVNCFHCGVNLRNWEPDDDPWQEHSRWYPACEFLKSGTRQTFRMTPVVQKCLDMGYDENLVKRLVDQKRKDGGEYDDVNTLVERVENTRIQQETHDPRLGTSGESGAAAGPSGAGYLASVVPSGASSLTEEYKQLKEQMICKICMEREVEVTFLPCGHLLACEPCAHKLKLCPMCRLKIRGTVRTYMS